MKIIMKNRGANSSPGQDMLSATASVGKAVLMTSFALIFGLVLLGMIIRWIIQGQVFELNQWIFTLVMIALLVGSVLIGRQIPRSIKLEREGESTEGKVMGVWQEVDDEGDRHYYIAFSAGGHTFKQQVNRSRFGAYGVGDSVEVRQCPDEPSIARLDF